MLLMQVDKHIIVIIIIIVVIIIIIIIIKKKTIVKVQVDWNVTFWWQSWELYVNWDSCPISSPFPWN